MAKKDQMTDVFLGRRKSFSNRLISGVLASLPLMLALISCDETTCKELQCGEHGTCVEGTSFGEDAVCSCSPGYAGKHCGECAGGFDWKNGDMSTGICVTLCPEGSQDNDGDGNCLPTCAAAALSCGDLTECSDASGVAECVCIGGYQDNDKDNICEPACAADSCSENMTCDDSSGKISCACSEGYQDNDKDGTCSESCAIADLGCSGDHVVCIDASGTAVCECEDGFVSIGGVCKDKLLVDSWTLLVYLDGDNNLSDFAAKDLDEMTALTAASRVNLLVLYDDYGRKDTKLYSIKGGQKVELNQEEVNAFIFDNGEADMDDWQTLKRFGVWGFENYPAVHYGLFMWNHGGGWKDESDSLSCRCGKKTTFREFCSDDHSSNTHSDDIEISNGDFGKAMTAITQTTGRKLDVIGFDACLMGMYEVATASASYADYLVASEEVEPAEGWPWDKVMKKVSENVEITPVELGTEIVQAYNRSGRENFTLSLTKLSLGDVHQQLDAFAKALKADLSSTASKRDIKSARKKAQSFDIDGHIDLIDFARKIASSTEVSDDSRKAAEALRASLRKVILINKTQSSSMSQSGVSEYDYSGAFGLAIFFPEEDDLEYSFYYSQEDWRQYKKAVWGNLSSWADFVDAYMQ